MELLLQRKANAAATNRNEQTPLTLATSAAVRTLLETAIAVAEGPVPDDPNPPAGGAPTASSAAGSGAGDGAGGGTGAGSSKARRERNRNRKRHRGGGGGGEDGGGDNEYGFQPWRPPQFDQLAAAEQAAASAGAAGPPDPAAPATGPVGPPAEADRASANPIVAEGGAPVADDAGAAEIGPQEPSLAHSAGAALVIGPPEGPRPEANDGESGSGAAAAIGPPEAPRPAANSAESGSDGTIARAAVKRPHPAAAAAGSVAAVAALPRKWLRVALGHLGDEEEGGEEEE